jgi:polyisoprenoid-binding protein YceI
MKIILKHPNFPKATFEGKFIEDIDFSKDGTYEVRAKGILDLHGIKQERIVKGTIKVNGSEITLNSQFIILLEDHNIKIPRVVYQKISPDIDVTITATMKQLQEKG